MAGGLDWIAVDWGTSNVRAWGIDADGEVLFERSSPQGMGKLKPADYPAVLEKLAGEDIETRTRVDVLICGMAGARQGWKEAPYVAVPAALEDLGSSSIAVNVPNSALKPRIIPGVCQRLGDEFDVMRGEETQLLGLTELRKQERYAVVLPGTHSKWVSISAGRISSFATAMTGELYEVLGTHTVLRFSMAGDKSGPQTEEGIEAGLHEGLWHPDLLSSLIFRARAASLLADRGADWCAGYLSGVLVGAEVGGHCRNTDFQATTYLIGAERLCRIYARAFAKLRLKTETVDATEATIAGLKAARFRVHA